MVKYLSTTLNADYRLAIANNGQKGIDKAIQLIPDLIITDVMMPEKDGFELCSFLKKHELCSHIPIIMLTAKADISSRIEGLETGADAYLSKPFNRKELLVRIRKLIELRLQLQEFHQIETQTQTRIQVQTQKDISPPTLFRVDTFLLKVQEMLEKHLSDENFGIVKLCVLLNVSRTQLHRKLKALTGQSTSLYIRSVRLQKAKTLLEQSELNVSEVAYKVGFKRVNYFSTVFSETYGYAPSELKTSKNG